MKDKKNYETENNHKAKPQVSISMTNLGIEIEEGKVFKDSFLIQSENGVPIKGKVFSTNDKVGLEKQDISGKRTEITYFFKGKLSMAGSEFEGDFVILTNGGEFNIPYRIHVIPKSCATSIGQINTMDEFARLYEENPKEAMELFFLSGFPEVFLGSDPLARSMYNSLMKGRSKPAILEEFITACGYKPPVEIQVDERTLVLENSEERAAIHLKLSGPGYIEGKIYSEKNMVRSSTDRFTQADFADGSLEVLISRNPKPASGSDVIHISTVRQDIRIMVEWWEDRKAFQGEQAKNYQIKQLKAELMHNYLYFRTGSIGFEDFIQEAHLILKDLLYMTGERVWNLYLVHLLMMEGSVSEARELEKELRESAKEEPFDDLASQYLLYLKAMINRTPDAIGEAVASIRQFYETSEYKAEALWMLIYLDREYVYNKRLQYDTIRQLFQEGNNSSLLYFEVCEILNENPNYMEEAGSFEISVFRWALRYGFVSLALAYRFSELALKMKYYSKSVFSIAVRLYDIEPDERFLQVVCSLLIKGNKVGRDYHRYFYHAVLANLKIVGLNEFFIRSMDFRKYEKIPQRVLIYFTYSNSLDYVEKAYLYTNILKNKDSYEEVFGAYHSKMLPFVEEQLRKGRMNEHLAFLYSHFQKECLEKPENVKAVCDVMFYRRLFCDNPRMTGVYVCNPETGAENYYPLSGGSCQVEVINKRAVIYFTDPAEQRYVTGIDYELIPFLSLSQFPEEWIRRNLVNKKILLTQSERIDDQVTESNLHVFQKIAFNQDYLQWIQSKALEKLLRYYQNHQNKKELARWLEKTAYTDITPGFRKQLMDFYMETGMMENAFFGAELYGSHIMGSAKRLKLASFGVSNHGDHLDETTLSLAYSASLRKKYNRDTLTYLMKFFSGELEDLLTIWERSRKIGLTTEAFERKIISQSIATGNHTAGVFPVFESFYEKNSGDPLTDQYLEYLSSLEMYHDMELSDSIHRIIGEEIVKGRIKDKRTKVRYLYYFADKPDWHEQISAATTMVIEEFLKEEFYLPVYEAYSEWVTLPIDYCERTFISYRGDAGLNIVLYYLIELEEDEPRECHLLEVLPGLYVTSLHFYQNDHVNYRLEADGEPVDNEKDILFETFEYEGDDSRFFELDHLEELGDEGEELKKYLLKAFFTDEYMTLL